VADGPNCKLAQRFPDRFTAAPKTARRCGGASRNQRPFDRPAMTLRPRIRALHDAEVEAMLEDRS